MTTLEVYLNYVLPLGIIGAVAVGYLLTRHHGRHTHPGAGE